MFRLRFHFEGPETERSSQLRTRVLREKKERAGSPLLSGPACGETSTTVFATREFKVKVGQSKVVSFKRPQLLNVRNAYALAMVTLMCSPAFAQFEKGTQSLNKVQQWLLSIGAVVVTLAIMFVGFRMMFQAAQWKDVAPVFWGGILVGGGSAFATLFF